MAGRNLYDKAFDEEHNRQHDREETHVHVPERGSTPGTPQVHGCSHQVGHLQVA